MKVENFAESCFMRNKHMRAENNTYMKFNAFNDGVRLLSTFANCIPDECDCCCSSDEEDTENTA
ncbi:unnamed protein product [marine sediment metagenome]|uniref:Uncharacterized protein n=1 Tax=marine sediment metagenome TaxID=412755 RepID=X1ABS5_9ZZZZ